MSTIVILVVCVIVVVIIFTCKAQNDNATIIGEENNDKPIFEDNIIPQDINIEGNVIMEVDDVFAITGRGTVVVGKIVNGNLQVGDEVVIQSSVVSKNINTTVEAIEMFRKQVTVASAGELVGVMLSDISKGDVQSGDYITK